MHMPTRTDIPATTSAMTPACGFDVEAAPAPAPSRLTRSQVLVAEVELVAVADAELLAIADIELVSVTDVSSSSLSTSLGREGRQPHKGHAARPSRGGRDLDPTLCRDDPAEDAVGRSAARQDRGRGQ